jgi:4-hydroxy-tetrahydrodipicolinate reductase
MKIALVGYGKMGRLVEQAAKEQGHEIVAIFDRRLGMPVERKHELSLADVAIDFSAADGILDQLACCADLNIPIVIGTTGWEEKLPEARMIIERSNGACLHSPNFSIGAYLHRKILRYAGSLFESFSEYDVCGIEWHHNQKIDTPSGTAIALQQDLMRQMPRLDSFQFSSVRCGSMPGTHTVHFDSPADTLTLTHTARNRTGFAYGALTASLWLIGKTGFFSLDNMMNEMTERREACI